MSPAIEIRLVVVRELRRSIRSAKGIALAALALLGAFVTSLACVWVEGSERSQLGMGSSQAYADVKREAIEKATGDPAFAAYFSSIPSSLFAFLKVTIWLTPLLVALLGFDSISSELQQRTVRFWAIRTRRWSYFAGKVLGLWVLVAIFTLVVDSIAGTVVLSRGFVTLGELFVWGARFWFVVLAIGGAWVAIATFISSCTATPIVALLTTFAVFFVLWLAGVGGFIERQRDSSSHAMGHNLSWFEYLYPNAYDTLLLSTQTSRVFSALAILMVFVVMMVIAGSVLYQRRDL